MVLWGRVSGEGWIHVKSKTILYSMQCEKKCIYHSLCVITRVGVNFIWSKCGGGCYFCKHTSAFIHRCHCLSEINCDFVLSRTCLRCFWSVVNKCEMHRYMLIIVSFDIVVFSVDCVVSTTVSQLFTCDLVNDLCFPHLQCLPVYFWTMKNQSFILSTQAWGW